MDFPQCSPEVKFVNYPCRPHCLSTNSRVKIGPKTGVQTFTTDPNPVPYGTSLVQIRICQFQSLFRTEQTLSRLDSSPPLPISKVGPESSH